MLDAEGLLEQVYISEWYHRQDLKAFRIQIVGSNQNRLCVLKNNIPVGSDCWPEETAWESSDEANTSPLVMFSFRQEVSEQGVNATFLLLAPQLIWAGSTLASSHLTPFYRLTLRHSRQPCMTCWSQSVVKVCCGSLVKASESPFASLMRCMKWWFQSWFVWAVSFWGKQWPALGSVCETAEKGRGSRGKGKREGSRCKEKGENTVKWSKTKSRGIPGGNHRRKRAE